MMLTYRDVYKMMFAVCDAVGHMPDVHLSAGERMELAGYLWREDDPFVREVAHALVEGREHFSAFPYQPEEMVGLLDRSDAFLALHLFFEKLAQNAWDCYLVDRATPIQQGLAVVQQVRLEDTFPAPSPGHKGRVEAIRFAEAELEERQQRNQRLARQRQQARTKPKPAPRKPKKKQSSPQARAMDAHRKSVTDKQLDAIELPKTAGRDRRGHGRDE